MLSKKERTDWEMSNEEKMPMKEMLMEKEMLDKKKIPELAGESVRGK